MEYKILLIDDDKELLKMLRSYFEFKNYIVMTTNSAIDSEIMLAQKPDIILLDINMPVMDGITYCRMIRDKVSCPIIFLTAKVEEQDKINGLLSGGDDYIMKPFSLKELEARIIAHLKREERHNNSSKFRFSNGLSIDYSTKIIQINGLTIGFTKAEYDIIEFLSTNAGQVFDKERIYEKIYGYDATGDSRGITELVRRIRRKIAVYTDQECIETAWGIGYRWRK
ncbi:response regulator transcription factor [Anaerosporobacter sp.]